MKRQTKSVTWLYGGPRTGHHFAADLLSLVTPVCLVRNDTGGKFCDEKNMWQKPSDNHASWKIRETRPHPRNSFLSGTDISVVSNLLETHDCLLLVESWSLEKVSEILSRMEQSKKYYSTTKEQKYCVIRNPKCVAASAVVTRAQNGSWQPRAFGRTVEALKATLLAGHKALDMVENHGWYPIFYDHLLGEDLYLTTDYARKLLDKHANLLDYSLPANIDQIYKNMQLNSSPNSSFKGNHTTNFRNRWEHPEIQNNEIFNASIDLIEKLTEEVNDLMKRFTSCTF